MNKRDARKIAETITNAQLKEMFETAKAKITDWTKVSSVNKGMTKGVAWNFLAKDFDVNKQYNSLSKRNMIWEFGDFLPYAVKPQKETKQTVIPIHQEPEF